MPKMMTISIVFILVQQRETLQIIKKLNSQLNRTSFNNSKYKLQTMHQILKTFRKVNHTTVILCAVISAYSRQWSLLISTIVPIQIYAISYIIYFFIFSVFHETQKFALILSILVIIVVVFVETNFCAQIDRYNLALNKQKMSFCWKINSLKQLSPSEKLKLKSGTEHERFTFKFIDGNSIDSGTFPYVSFLL